MWENLLLLIIMPIASVISYALCIAIYMFFKLIWTIRDYQSIRRKRED